MSNQKQVVLQQAHGQLNKFLDKKQAALPSDFNETRFLQNCMTVLQDTKNIEKMKPVSIARTMLKGAFLGLDFFNGECYAIPYGNDLNFQTDYKGEIKLAKKYSINDIQDIYAKVVREGDFFEEKISDGKQSIDFRPKSFNDGDIIGAFAVCLYKDGSMIYETMSKKEIEKIRSDFSKMPNSLMWKKTPGEAYKKTVLRRLTKMIELDFGNQERKKAYDNGSDMEFEEEKKNEEKSPFDEKDEAVDVDYEDVEDEEPEDDFAKDVEDTIKESGE